MAIFILNNQYYMSNESLLLSENESNYSSIAVLNYSYYTDTPLIEHQEEIQAIIGVDYIPLAKPKPLPLLTLPTESIRYNFSIPYSYINTKTAVKKLKSVFTHIKCI